MEKKEFIVVGNGYHFVEAIKIDAVSAEDATFVASKRMKADHIVFTKSVEELNEFLVDCYTCGTFRAYIAQLENGTVEVGAAESPNYRDKQPHENLEICWAINRILRKESECYHRCSHVVIGERLPRIIIGSSCYYCGDSTECYF
jgi:hypothetical protein